MILNTSILDEIEDMYVEGWPSELQSLVDKGLIKVTYDHLNRSTFSLTELGHAVLREIDLGLN